MVGGTWIGPWRRLAPIEKGFVALVVLCVAVYVGLDLELHTTLTVIHPTELRTRLCQPHTFMICGSSRGGTTAIAYALVRGGVDLGNDLPLNLEDTRFVKHIREDGIDEAELKERIAERAGQTGGSRFRLALFISHGSLKN